MSCRNKSITSHNSHPSCSSGSGCLPVNTCILPLLPLMWQDLDCAPLWATAGGDEALQRVASAASHQVANSSHHEVTWHHVTVASFTVFPACFLLHPLSFSTHTFISNVFSVSISYKTGLKKSTRKDLSKILFERRDQINISSLWAGIGEYLQEVSENLQFCLQRGSEDDCDWLHMVSLTAAKPCRQLGGLCPVGI